MGVNICLGTQSVTNSLISTWYESLGIFNIIRKRNRIDYLLLAVSDCCCCCLAQSQYMSCPIITGNCYKNIGELQYPLFLIPVRGKIAQIDPLIQQQTIATTVTEIFLPQAMYFIGETIAIILSRAMTIKCHISVQPVANITIP